MNYKEKLLEILSGEISLSGKEFNHFVDIIIFDNCPHPDLDIWNIKKEAQCNHCGSSFYKRYNDDINEYQFTEYNKKYKTNYNENGSRFLSSSPTNSYLEPVCCDSRSEECIDYNKLFTKILSEGFLISFLYEKDKDEDFVHKCTVTLKDIKTSHTSYYIGEALAFAYLKAISFIDKKNIVIHDSYVNTMIT